MRTSTLPECPCPHCGKKNDRASHIGNATPGPGDVVICIGCGELAEYAPDMMLQALSEDTLAEINLAEIQALRRLWSRYKERQTVTPSATPA